MTNAVSVILVDIFYILYFYLFLQSVFKILTLITTPIATASVFTNQIQY